MHMGKSFRFADATKAGTPLVAPAGPVRRNHSSSVLKSHATRFPEVFLCTALCVLGLWQGAGDAAAAELSYGRQVILNRGLQIQSLAFVSSTPAAPTNYSLWAGANFTTFNSWNDANSEKTLGWTMPWSRWIKTDGSNPL